MAVGKGIESSVYILLLLTWGCLFAVYGPLVAEALEIVSVGSAGAILMMVALGAWPVVLAVIGATLLASLIILAIGSWPQRFRVAAWYATVCVFFVLSYHLRAVSVDAAASVGAIGFALTFSLACYWLVRTRSTVALWTFEISSLMFVMVALFILAIEPLYRVGALAGIVFFGLCAFTFARMLVNQRRSDRPVRP